MSHDRELRKGSAEVLILSLLDERDRHGYEIAKLIERAIRRRAQVPRRVALPDAVPPRAPRPDSGPLGRKERPTAEALLPSNRRRTEDARVATQKLERVLLGAEPRRADPAGVGRPASRTHARLESLIRARVAPLSGWTPRAKRTSSTSSRSTSPSTTRTSSLRASRNADAVESRAGAVERSRPPRTRDRARRSAAPLRAGAAAAGRLVDLGTSAATSATRSGCCAAHQDSPLPPSSRWRSASAPTSRSSASSGRSC